MLVPTVVERTASGERAFDIYSRLLGERIIFLHGELQEDTANLIIAQMLHLEGEAPDRPVSLYINSPGGDMNALFAVYDAMQFISADVYTVCAGQAASAAAVLLAAGAPGHRAVLPNSRVLLHQPHGGAQGQSTDLEIFVQDMVVMRERMLGILADATGKTTDALRSDIDRDFILRGEDAVNYGVVDHVISRREPRPTTGFRPAA